MPQFVFLWTDLALWGLVLAAIVYALIVRRSPNMRANWRRVLTDAPAMCSAVVLSIFVAIGLLDSIHYRPQLPVAPGASPYSPRTYAPIVRSALEELVQGSLLTQPERRFSAPLATRTYYKESMLTDTGPVRDFRRL